MHCIVKLFIASVIVLVQSVQAQAATLLRDADMEYALRQLAEPVLTAAGLSASSVKVLVIKDDRLNAFVVDHNHIFIHSGLLLKMSSAEQLQSVLAHEAAHIANGHIQRRYQNLRTAKSISGLGLALAVAAAAAGADGNAAAGIGIGITGSANRVFTSHTRAEESAADASAIRYMIAAQANPKAFMEVLDIFRGQELVGEHRRDPYARTHPLTRDRLRAVKALTQGAKPIPANAKSAYWFERAQGKLSSFLRAPSWTLRRAKSSSFKDVMLMRQAVAYHRKPDTTKALQNIQALIAQRPNDPYVHDLHGQILLESRRANEAVNAYARASKLAPRNALILGGHGRALLAAGRPRQALSILEKARARDFSDPRILRDLANAYAQSGKTSMASLVTAERYALSARFKDALIHAKRAAGQLPNGSTAWRRAQDVISAAEAHAKQRK